jgi:uncharacterized membrane protein YGL010W
MRTAQAWLDEYAQSHLNPCNQLLHFACIPLIVFSVVCALKAIPFGTVWVNAASIVIVAALIYYWLLSWRLAFGATAILALFYAGVLAVEAAVGSSLIWVALAIFVLGWIGQFVGHQIEGVRPAFFKDMQFLLIGPLWEMAHLYRRFGLPIGDAAGPVSTRR